MPMDANCVLLRDGKFDAANGSDAENLKRIFAGIRVRRPKQLVLHFHGGLVPREDAVASARRLAREYEKCGAESLFVVWESGLTEIISQKLPLLQQEKLFQTIQLRVSQFVKAKLDKLLSPLASRGQGLPIELLDSLQRLVAARQAIVAAVIGYDEAQFQLFVALGQPPTVALPSATALCEPPPATAHEITNR